MKNHYLLESLKWLECLFEYQLLQHYLYHMYRSLILLNYKYWRNALDCILNKFVITNNDEKKFL